jgi:DNA invertase Pin-like site-specific DNA recombinase
MKTLYGYYRVSTKHQAEDGQTLKRYREQLLDINVPEENIFFDVESGGGIAKRAGYQSLMSRLRANNHSILIVPCFDRLHRSTLNWEVARKEFIELGIELRTIGGGEIDFKSPQGHYNASLQSAMAEYQREKNQQYAIEGHQYLREKKIPFSAPFGYRIVDKKIMFDDRLYLDSDKTAYQVAREAIDLLLAGKTPKEIRDRAFSIYGYPTKKGSFPRTSNGFYKWLQTETLRGILVFRPNGEVITYPNNHESLINLNDWLEIEKIIDRLKGTRKAKVNKNPLLGVAFCGNCGGKMALQQSHNKYFYLVCYNSCQRDGKPASCSERSTYGLQVTDYIKATTSALRTKAKELVEWGWSSVEKPIPPEILELQKQISFLDANDPDLQSAITVKTNRLNYLLEQSLATNLTEEKAIADLVAIAQDERFWELASYRELNLFFRDTVASVVHNKGTITVTLKV